MRDPRPLSQRFDLSYVHRRTPLQMWIMRVSLGLAMIGGLLVLGSTAQGRREMYSPGHLSGAHANLSCNQCHQRDPDRAGYWLTAHDSACLNCHVAAAHEPHGTLFVGTEQPSNPALLDRAGVTKMSGQCRVCHVEHYGVEHDLKRLPDATCVQCHGDLPRYLLQGANTAAQRHERSGSPLMIVSDRLHALAQLGGGQ